ncbi:MAG: alpha-galactosidase, partial [Acidobacteriaceae bacterium]
VKWEGTNETAGTYGGLRTSEQSYLPRRNPEVMHMGLGHVSGAGMHGLFDRKSDTAIDFGADAILQVDAGTTDAYAITIPIHGHATIQLTPDYFTKVLHVPFYTRYDDTHSPTAPIVWSSWPSYYETVTERDIVRNTDWLSTNLKQYGFQYVVLDDGYDRPPHLSDVQASSRAVSGGTQGHAWIQNWNPDRFPHGPQWLTRYIHARGLSAGLWLVPNSYGPGLKEHPDWYLYDKEGKVLLDYNTPALDSTNPRVLEFLGTLFTRLDDLGFDYYKFDGESALPAYAPSVDKSRLYSPSEDPVEAFRKRFAVIRRTVGPERFIEECPAGSPLNAIGFVNSYFNGDDVYDNWDGMYPLFSSIIGNLFLNHMVAYVMPGEGLALGEPMTMAQAAAKRSRITVDMVRSRDGSPSGLGTTLPEARTLVTYAALTGVVYPLASVMPELPPERVKLLEATMPTLPILPIDLFSRGANKNAFPEVLDLKINSPAGVYDVAAETNWQSETTERNLSFNQLGLALNRRYVVFDFWKQQPVGVFVNKLDLSIGPHDTRVLLIHPAAERPQLIGNSRHISGTYSIVSQGWNGTAKELQGESTTVPGKPYTLWFYIPNSYTEVSLQVTLKTGKAVAGSWQQHGQFGSLRFTGANEPVMWRVHF